VNDPEKFNLYINDYLNTQAGKADQSNVGFRGGKVILTRIAAKVKVVKWAASSVKQPELDKWQDWVNKQAAIAPPGMRNILQTSDAWIDIPSERAFVRGAFSGILTSIIFSFIVLMVVTRNLLTSLASIFCVTVIIFSIITFMYWNG
jgi:predicted RND superfamily exporter protein